MNLRISMISLIALVAFGVSAEELPFSSFGHLPAIEQPRVSPDGKYVAAILNSEQGPTIVVAEFGSTDIGAIARLRYGVDRIEWITWANNDTILISASEQGPQRTGNFVFRGKYRTSRLYQISRGGGDLKEIRRKVSNVTLAWTQWLDTDTIISMLPDDPDHILLQLYDENDSANVVFKVDIKKNKFEKMFRNSYDVSRWIADRKGNVLFGLEYNQNTNEATIWYRPDNGKKWEPLHTRKAYEDNSFSPVYVDEKKAIVITDYELGREAVWQYDIASGTYEEVLFAVEGLDISGAILSNDRSSMLGVYYYDDFRVDYYFDESAKQKAELIKSSFPGYQTRIASRSLDEQRMIVRLDGDNIPPRYMWIDVEKSAGGAWFGQYPDLAGQAMSEVVPIEFEASDGMTLSGYLTMPPGIGATESEGDKPGFIVFPHGGPSSRDYRHFDPFVQFFANRGYAVLQVNFRGSSGFGDEFLGAGYREWGQAMQQDVYDAIDWVEKQGIVDSERKCVVGASYGGYVALVAAYQKPHDFVCIASIAGISDLHALAKEDSISRGSKLGVATEIGDPFDSDDSEMLNEYSAKNHVEKIRAPLLLIHGTVDTRVPIAQTVDFFQRAKASGVDVELVKLKDGTHFLDEYANRLAVFQALDVFLKKHLH